MNVLFVGLGSIAGRHIKNLKSLELADLEIDVIRSGVGKEASPEIESLIDRVVLSEEDLDDSYDAVFVTNPTSLHYDTLIKYRSLSDYFFVEKPVFVTGEENIQPFQEENKHYYIACPLRYSNVIQWVKNNMDFSSVYSMRVISSSYLPDWRPNSDYRDTYSSRKDMGGGVSIDLIHEWDYITYLVGFPNRVQSYIGKKSHLEIDSDDLAIYIAEYDDKMVEVHLDYFGRKATRQIVLYTKDDTIVADLIEQKITWMKSEKEVDLHEERDSYQIKELKHFIDIITKEACNSNNIDNACRVLRIARGSE